MARTNKNMEWTMIDANMKSHYLQEKKFGGFFLYSMLRSRVGRICLAILVLWFFSLFC